MISISLSLEEHLKSIRRQAEHEIQNTAWDLIEFEQLNSSMLLHAWGNLIGRLLIRPRPTSLEHPQHRPSRRKQTSESPCLEKMF